MTSRNIFFGTTSQGKISFDIVTGNFTLGNSNVDLIHMNSNTNIGVGFTIIQTPTFRLDVSGGDINTDGSYRINGIEVLTSSGLGSGITSIGPLDSLVINNDLTVDGNTLYVDSSGNQVGIGTTSPNFTLDVNGSVSIGTTLVVEGDLTVNGTLTTINTENLTVEDPMIKLAKSNMADTIDIGFFGLYNDGTSKYSGIFRDASDEVFKFFTGTTIEPTTTVDIIPANGYTDATILVGHITASTTTISNDLIVNTTLFVDSSIDTVGINNTTPSEALDVVGNIGVSGNILPTLDDTFDLGTTIVRFRDLFLSSGTLHIGGGQIGAGTGSDISITNNLTVENNCTVVGDLNVTGAFTTTGTVDISDNLTLSGTLDVTGIGTFETDLVVADNFTVDTNTLVVDSSNNRVGIGLTNPSTPLDVIGDINTSTDYNISGTQVLSTTTLGSGVVNSSLTSVGTLTSLEISGDLLVDTNTLFVDSSLNRVGIGTTSPLFELDVSGDINSTGSDYRIDGTSVLNATTLGGTVTNSFLNLNTGDMIQAGIFNLTSGNDYQINSSSVLNTTTLGGTVVNSSLTSVSTLTTLDVSGDLSVDSNTLYVDASANSVGIGITVPVSKLDVIADTANDGDETGAHGIRIQTGSTNQSLMMGYDGTDDIGYINSGKTGSTTNLVLQTRGGNVGIGITNPTAGLQITTIHSEDFMTNSLKLPTNGGTSFVRFGRTSTTTDELFIISKNLTRNGGFGRDDDSTGSQYIAFNIDGSFDFATQAVGITDSIPPVRTRIDNANIQFFAGSTNNNVGVLELRASHTGTNNARYIEFFTSATTITDGTSEGFVTTDGSGNLAFLDASDRRLKKNIIEYDNGDEIIKSLRTVKYDWKDEDKPNDCLGFIAQEVQEVLPRSVSEFENGYLGMSRVEMIPIMWSALRKSLKEIDELKLRINQLESN